MQWTNFCHGTLNLQVNNGTDRTLTDNQINANLLRKWQHAANQQKGIAKLLPIQVASTANSSTTDGNIEIAIGAVLIRFNGPVDPGNARTLLDLLR